MPSIQSLASLLARCHQYCFVLMMPQDQLLYEVIHEAMSRHMQGIEFRERKRKERTRRGEDKMYLLKYA